MIDRRQRQQYIFATFLAVIAVINLLFYFILTRPLQTEYVTLQASIDQLQKEIANSNKNFAYMDKTSSQLKRFEQDRGTLLMRLVQRNTGYSEILDKINSIVQHTGVKWSRQGFNQDPKPQAGLNSLSIVLPLEGNYTNIVNFIRELEDSDTVFLVTAISVERSTPASVQTGTFTNAAANANAAAGSVSLSLTLETYFYQ